jgi:hypothetical protein
VAILISHLLYEFDYQLNSGITYFKRGIVKSVVFFITFNLLKNKNPPPCRQGSAVAVGQPLSQQPDRQASVLPYFSACDDIQIKGCKMTHF